MSGAPLFGEAGSSAGLSRIVRRAIIEIGEDEVDGRDDRVAAYAVKAVDAINGIRGFTATDEHPVEARYESVAVDLTVYAWSKRGAEGQTSHSENGIGRGYESALAFPPSLLSQVAPVVRVPNSTSTA